MADTPDPDSKTEEASPRKLADARKKGDVAKSPDVAAALSLAGAAAVVLMSGGWFANSMAEQLLPFIAAPHTMLGGLDEAEPLRPQLPQHGRNPLWRWPEGHPS